MVRTKFYVCNTHECKYNYRYEKTPLGKKRKKLLTPDEGGDGKKEKGKKGGKGKKKK